MVERILVRIRPAVPGDLSALEWEGEYSRYREVYRKAMEESQRGQRLILVAELEGEVVGQIFVQYQSTPRDPWDEGSSGYFYAFRVRPKLRNQTIGTQLVEAAESHLVERGFDRAVIAVAKDNPAAERLYARLGYIRFGEDPGNWSYRDEQGRIQHVFEPSNLLHKWLTRPPDHLPVVL